MFTTSHFWYSMDDKVSFREKLNFAMEKGLAGSFIYPLEDDDFRGSCNFNKNETFPLTKMMLIMTNNTFQN